MYFFLIFFLFFRRLQTTSRPENERSFSISKSGGSIEHVQLAELFTIAILRTSNAPVHNIPVLGYYVQNS